MGLAYTQQQAMQASLDEHAQMICNAQGCRQSFDSSHWLVYWQGMYEGAKASGNEEKAALALEAQRRVARGVAEQERREWAAGVRA